MEVLQVYREPTIVPNWPYATGGILSLSELFHIWNDHLPIQIHCGTTSDFNFGFFSCFPVYRNTNRWVYAGNNETFNSWCDPTMDLHGVNTEQLGRWRCLSSSMSTSSFVHLWISMKAVIHKGRKRPRVSGYQDLTSSTRVWRLLVIHKDKGKGAKVKLMSMGLIPRISGILTEAYPKLLVCKTVCLPTLKLPCLSLNHMECSDLDECGTNNNCQGCHLKLKCSQGRLIHAVVHEQVRTLGWSEQ